MAHAQSELLLHFLLELTKNQLQKHVSFHPIAASTDTSGQPTLEAVHTGNEHPKPEELMTEYSRILKEKAKQGSITAAGTTLDVKITKEDGSATDAIQIDLEHVSGESMTLFLSYIKNGSG